MPIRFVRKMRKMTAICLAVICVCASIGGAGLVSATTVSSDEIQAQIERDQANLDSINSQIASLADENDLLQEEIDDLNSEVINLMTSINLKQGEIDEKEALIAVKESEIEEKEAQIEQARRDYEDAKDREEEQYEAMKIRIRFMYENSETSILAMILESSSISDALDRAEYIERVYEYDQDMLLEYEESKQEVQNLWDRLVEDEENLLEEKSDLESEVAVMESDRNELSSLRSSLDSNLTTLKAQSSDYTSLIASYQSQANTAAANIKAEQSALKEAMEAEAAAAEAAAAAAAADESSPAASSGTGTTSSNTASSNTTSSNTTSSNTASSNTTSSNTSGSSASGSGSSGSSSSSGIGSAGSGNYKDTGYISVINNAGGSTLGKNIAKYACQFIGNPYVAGGTSLTNGADCSGFTYRVYADFGYSIPRTSTEQRNAGKEVSYSNAEPGDIVCYSGHVGLYIGGGLIVHASSSTTGIKVSNATYKTILSVRRII